MAKSQIALKITKNPRLRQKTPMTSEKALDMVIGTHSLPAGTTSELRALRLTHTTQIVPGHRDSGTRGGERRALKGEEGSEGRGGL